MPNYSPARLLDDAPEAFVSTTRVSREVSRRFRAGRLRKLASRLYTTNMADPPETVVRRNVWSIVAGYFPGALIADRTALENEPASDGSVFLVTRRGSAIQLPGIILRPRRGVGTLPTDRPFLHGLFLSSTARAYLDNLRPSRARAGRSRRTLTRQEMETRLDDLVRRAGAGASNRLRDEARAIAAELDRGAELATLSKLISSLSGTHAGRLTTPVGRARRRGRPYDARRLEQFGTLHAALRAEPPTMRAALPRDAAQQTVLSFFEAYYSNYIEGTEFTVDEAVEIVFQGRIPASRPADAHDIEGTWRLASDPDEMNLLPRDSSELLEILRHRHSTILGSRPEVLPGEFKRAPNQSGGNVFVMPEDVVGTLEQAFPLYRSLETAFQRAVFLLYLVSEVHPFADGNGRVARIMMNAELASRNEERIVIPTVYRGNYLAALRAMSHNNVAEPLIRSLDYAQRWTGAIRWRTVADATGQLTNCNAFLESEVAENQGLRLRMPNGDV